MITITPFSKSLYLLNEEIRLSAAGDRKTVFTGSPASLDIIIVLLSVNDYFTLTIDQTVIRFDAVANPDDSGQQITAGNNLATILDDLKTNYTLIKNYTLSIITGKIHLQATAPGSIFTIKTDFTHAPNASEATNTPGTNDVINENYGILYSLEEKSATGAEYTELTSFISNGVNEIKVNIDEFIKKIIWPNTLPIFGAINPVLRNDFIRTFRIRLVERYGTTPQLKRVYTSDSFSVLRFELPGVLASDFDLHTYFQYAKRFLTEQPVIRRTWLGAPLYLTFFNPLPGVNAFHVNITYLNDDFTTTALTAFYLSNSNQNDIFQLFVSPPAGIKSFTIQVECQTVPYAGQIVINPVTYNLVEQSEFGRAFIYLNTFGAWETLHTWATMKTNLTTTRVQQINNSEKTSIIDAKQEVYEVTTSQITHDEAITMRDVLSSEQFFLVGSSAFIPVILEPGSFVIDDEYEDLISVKFSYSYADTRLKDNQYNPDKIYFDKVGFTSNFKIN